jgi:hypothetical protein
VAPPGRDGGESATRPDEKGLTQVFLRLRGGLYGSDVARLFGAGRPRLALGASADFARALTSRTICCATAFRSQIIRIAPSIEMAQPLSHLETTYLFDIGPPEDPERKNCFWCAWQFVAKARICTRKLGRQRGGLYHLMQLPKFFGKEGEALLNDSEQSEAGMRPSVSKKRITNRQAFRIRATF